MEPTEKEQKQMTDSINATIKGLDAFIEVDDMILYRGKEISISRVDETVFRVEHVNGELTGVTFIERDFLKACAQSRLMLAVEDLD